VLDGGINLIGTSPDYGRSEELIGRDIAVAERGPLPEDVYEEARRRLPPPGA
jgi:aryl-alcohol dehydrogenase-like predicted oxidoreductase